MMLTFPISLSASSCEFAQSAVSSAYLRLETNFPPIFIPNAIESLTVIDEHYKSLSIHIYRFRHTIPNIFKNTY